MPHAITERGPVSEAAIEQLFHAARTRSVWLDRPVPERLLREVYELARLGPTSANSQPARFVFLTTDGAKARLLPAMSRGNHEQTRTAPVVVLVAWDTEFYNHLPRTFPSRDMRATFASNPALAEETAFRNSSLAGGYFILAARALGLDCGPMSGFNAEKVNGEFFPEGKWKVNFICNLGYGDPSHGYPRLPRLDFEEACRVL
ncbi:MAG TPA: malonic semialdehyde reductase [Bryobacteraceae bacterium]|nr:malonic semialdehyde reductase [Bryobacteraceae bacterium]